MRDIQTINGRRVYCGRCHHDDDQRREVGGRFDAPGVLTFSCGNCSAVYAVCERCAWFVADASACERCAVTPVAMLPAEERRVMLPAGMQEHEMGPDPGNRPDRWQHLPTQRVVKMPPGWRPTKAARPIIDGEFAEDFEDLTGQDVMILEGRYSGQRGVITESGVGEDYKGVRVAVENGVEAPFETFAPYLRLLTDAEKAALAKTVTEAKASRREVLAEKRAARDAKVATPKAESGGVSRGA